ncbi:MAG: tetratricopeptide repeat protein, partial [Caldilineaceae bacterium]|nr:tetratricopeptide repeat protein [Caldilineaceae bacterium]
VEESLHIYRALEDRRGESSALNTLGDTAYYQGHYMTALSFYEQALEIANEIDERRQLSMVLTNLGIFYRDLGDFLRAERFLDQALMIKEEIGFRRGEGWIWICQALLRHQRDEHEDALNHSQRALTLFNNLGDHIGQAYALTQCGHAYAGLGDLVGAEQAYRQTLALRQELRQPHLTLDLKAGLARVALRRSEVEEALAWVEEILAFLQNGSINGSDEPGRIYLTCYNVLAVAGDSRAGAVLDEARSLLRDRATRISDVVLRRAYLEAVPTHREILAIVHPGI